MMNLTSAVLDIRARLAPGRKALLLAYGSSNTERHQPGMHWFDILELLLRDAYGRFHQCLNAGICGDTSRGLLERFDRDAAPFKPGMAIVTIGGNDRDPVQGISPAQFELNLKEIQKRFSDIGCCTVFQTYYSVDPARTDHLSEFFDYMEIVRTVARETGSGLVDHLVRWEAFRKRHPDRYLELMLDGFHVNFRGNAVLGLDAARAFGAEPAKGNPGFWDEAIRIQKEMDALTQAS